MAVHACYDAQRCIGFVGQGTNMGEVFEPEPKPSKSEQNSHTSGRERTAWLA